MKMPTNPFRVLCAALTVSAAVLSLTALGASADRQWVAAHTVAKGKGVVTPIVSEIVVTKEIDIASS